MNRLAAFIVSSLVLSAAIGGCEAPTTPPVPGADGYALPKSAPDASYSTRGRVIRLPGEREAGSELRIEHEAIPDFKNKEGKVVGMGSMPMPMPPAKGVPINALRVGDVIAFKFSVWWNENPTYLMTEYTKLPAGTVLSFDAEKTPATPGASGAAPASGARAATGAAPVQSPPG